MYFGGETCMNICILVGTDNLRGEKNNLRTEFLVLYIYIISIFCTKFYLLEVCFPYMAFVLAFSIFLPSKPKQFAKLSQSKRKARIITFSNPTGIFKDICMDIVFIISIFT